MAADRQHLSSVESSIIALNDCLNINKLKTSQLHNTSLIVDNGKLKWIGSYEELKDFVKRVLELTGKWSSPGGYLKLFTEASQAIVIRYYTNTDSFLVQGLKGEEFMNWH